MRLANSAEASCSSASSSPTNPPAKLPRRRMDSSHYKSGFPLQRGSACLSCRKRKMKCDAGKPACGQCVKANRAPDCDYDDGKSKSRTQLLQEKIAALEARLRELESPAAAAPALHRFNSAPSAHTFYPDPVFPAATAAAAAAAPFDLPASSPPSPAGSQWTGDQYDLQMRPPTRVTSPDQLPWDMAPDDLLKASGRWWEADEPPPHIKQLLIDVFLPHRHQCGFELDLARFQASLASPSAGPHPALLNAIYALACHFSLSPLLAPHEPRFVARALRAVAHALEASDRLLHVLHASCLLAVLFFAKGRLLEGYYHAGAAARLAVGLGLHQIAAPDAASPGASPASPSADSASASAGAAAAAAAAAAASSSILPPPVDSVELGERILAFWQVFNLDRCWAVATGLPVALSDDNHPRTRIETVWPRALDEYELDYAGDADYGTVHVLYSQPAALPYATHDSTNALRAKATTLFERASRLCSSFGTSAQSPDQFWLDFQTVDAAIARLAAGVPPAAPTPGAPVHHAVFVVHALLHAATIQLHSPFALKDAASQQKSAATAALATAMIHDLDDMDYPFLDPIMGTCWTSVAEALVRELILLRSASSGSVIEQQVAARNRQLDVVVLAMNRLGATVPLAAYQASKVEQSRIVSF